MPIVESYTYVVAIDTSGSVVSGSGAAALKNPSVLLQKFVVELLGAIAVGVSQQKQINLLMVYWNHSANSVKAGMLVMNRQVPAEQIVNMIFSAIEISDGGTDFSCIAKFFADPGWMARVVDVNKNRPINIRTLQTLVSKIVQVIILTDGMIEPNPVYVRQIGQAKIEPSQILIGLPKPPLGTSEHFKNNPNIQIGWIDINK